MVLENLDRTQWSFAEARAHAETVVVAHRADAACRRPPEPARALQPWERPEDPRAKWQAEAHEQLLVALRDGDLHAQGRFSETRNDRTWGQDFGTGWVLHSGHHQPISPTQWREGQSRGGTLSSMFWEFIDIRMPRFVVRAIWPEFVPPASATGASEAPYTTPYLDLMQAAIAKFGITPETQGKKECLVD